MIRLHPNKPLIRKKNNPLNDQKCRPCVRNVNELQRAISDPNCDEITITENTEESIFLALNEKAYAQIKTLWLGTGFKNYTLLNKAKNIREIGINSTFFSKYKRDYNVNFPVHIQSIACSGSWPDIIYHLQERKLLLANITHLKEVTIIGSYSEFKEDTITNLYSHSGKQWKTLGDIFIHNDFGTYTNLTQEELAQITQVNLGRNLSQSEVSTFFGKDNTSNNKIIGISGKTPPDVIQCIPKDSTIFLGKGISSDHLEALSKIQVKKIIFSEDVSPTTIPAQQHPTLTSLPNYQPQLFQQTPPQQQSQQLQQQIYQQRLQQQPILQPLPMDSNSEKNDNNWIDLTNSP